MCTVSAVLPAPIASARASALAPCQWLCHSGSWRCYLRLLRWHCGSCQWHSAWQVWARGRHGSSCALAVRSATRFTSAGSQSALLAPRSCQPECERERHRALQVRSVLGPARPPGSAATGRRSPGPAPPPTRRLWQVTVIGGSLVPRLVSGLGSQVFRETRAATALRTGQPGPCPGDRPGPWDSERPCP